MLAGRWHRASDLDNRVNQLLSNAQLQRLPNWWLRILQVSNTSPNCQKCQKNYSRIEISTPKTEKYTNPFPFAPPKLLTSTTTIFEISPTTWIAQDTLKSNPFSDFGSKVTSPNGRAFSPRIQDTFWSGKFVISWKVKKMKWFFKYLVWAVYLRSFLR